MPFDPIQIKEEELEGETFCQKPIKSFDDHQVSIIRKEFIALTGDHFSAVILNQLLYWTQRVRDFDLLLEEERNFNPDYNLPPRHGWIYKTANDLIDETMLGMSHPTMRKYLKYLIDCGWLDERPHPNNKWNKTTQYRVNLRKLHSDLITIGHNFPLVYLKTFSSSLKEDNLKDAFSSPSSETEETSNVRILQSDVSHLHSDENSHATFLHDPLKTAENPNVKILQSNVKNLHSDVSSLHSDVRNLHSYTYTENTTKNTNKDHTQKACANFENVDFEKIDFSKNDFEKILEVWKTYIGQEVHPTDERTRKLESLLNRYFQGDLTQWEAFCKRIASSPFLMGQGPRKWRVSLDWILCEENLLKVVEGNFDDGSIQDQKVEKLSEEAKAKEVKTVLASIEDPLWKEWCSQLDFSPESRNSVSLRELKSIANARFLEVEDDRLVWIGSHDAQVLSKIEDLRLKLLTPIERTFPKVRMLRTRLGERESPSSQPSTQPIHQKRSIQYE